MNKTATTIAIRSKNKGQLAGSQSLGGKTVATASSKATKVKGIVPLGDSDAKLSVLNKYFDEMRREEKLTFKMALKELDMEYWKTPADKEEALTYARKVGKTELLKIEAKRLKALAKPDVAIARLGL